MLEPVGEQCGLTAEQINAMAEMLLGLPPLDGSVDRTKSKNSRPATKQNQRHTTNDRTIKTGSNK